VLQTVTLIMVISWRNQKAVTTSLSKRRLQQVRLMTSLTVQVMMMPQIYSNLRIITNSNTTKTTTTSSNTISKMDNNSIMTRTTNITSKMDSTIMIRTIMDHMDRKPMINMMLIKFANLRRICKQRNNRPLTQQHLQLDHLLRNHLSQILKHLLKENRSQVDHPL